LSTPVTDALDSVHAIFDFIQFLLFLS